jgi:hypothetical protein
MIAEATSLRISGVRHAFGSQATWMKGIYLQMGGVFVSGMRPGPLVLRFGATRDLAALC